MLTSIYFKLLRFLNEKDRYVFLLFAEKFLFFHTIFLLFPHFLRIGHLTAYNHDADDTKIINDSVINNDADDK